MDAYDRSWDPESKRKSPAVVPAPAFEALSEGTDHECVAPGRHHRSINLLPSIRRPVLRRQFCAHSSGWRHLQLTRLPTHRVSQWVIDHDVSLSRSDIDTEASGEESGHDDAGAQIRQLFVGTSTKSGTACQQQNQRRLNQVSVAACLFVDPQALSAGQTVLKRA
jgi:hypothetical protein